MTLDNSKISGPYQRILIGHLTLPEQCRNGKSLGEGASIAELGEQILYYYRDQQEECDFQNELPSQQADSNATEEAVQFFGLCTALYGLASSLLPEADSDQQQQQKQRRRKGKDRAREVYFEKSTLVYVPLESSDEDLIAVVQLSRLNLPSNAKENNVGGGNALAVRAAMERQSKLFSLLRGGIMARLRPSFNEMGELYELLKKIRVLQERSSRSRRGSDSPDNTNNNESSNVELESLAEQVKALRSTLPISSIRRDLDSHFREFLTSQAAVVANNGGAARCLVETIPQPLFCPTYAHATVSPPAVLSSYATVTLGIEVRRLLQEVSNGEKEELSLMGLTTFVQGNLLHTHLSHSILFQQLAAAGYNNVDPLGVSNEIAHLIMHHMTSYKAKMAQLPASLNSDTSWPGTPAHSKIGIRGFGLSFGDTTDATAKVGPKTSLPNENFQTKNVKDQNTIRGSFIPPPPQFMLSAFEEAPDAFEVSGGQMAWALKINLPLQTASGNNEYVISAQACVYELGDCSFLLFFCNSSPYGSPGTMLASIQTRLSEILTFTADDNKQSKLRQDEALESMAAEPGQDIVLIDREQHKLILFSGHSQNNELKRKKGTSRRFLGFGSKGSNDTAHPISNQMKKIQMEWVTNGLDCRHFLVSHLHLDTVLAFDDMMNEVARRKKSAQENRSLLEPAQPFVIEMCTCMPLGWAYSYVEDEKELYAFFDSSVHVTVADVQNATAKIQEKFFWKQRPQDVT